MLCGFCGWKRIKNIPVRWVIKNIAGVLSLYFVQKSYHKLLENTNRLTLWTLWWDKAEQVTKNLLHVTMHAFTYINADDFLKLLPIVTAICDFISLLQSITEINFFFCFVLFSLFYG